MQEFKIKMKLGRAQKTKDQQILVWQKKSRSNQVSRFIFLPDSLSVEFEAIHCHLSDHTLNCTKYSR